MIKNKKQKNKIISLDNVSISYGSFEVVKNIYCDFEINPDEQEGIL